MVICDKCMHHFNFVQPLRRRVKSITSEKVIEIYFICPECKAEYHSYYETKETSRLMARNNALRGQADHKGIKINQEYIKMEQDRVKKLMGG